MFELFCNGRVEITINRVSWHPTNYKVIGKLMKVGSSKWKHRKSLVTQHGLIANSIVLGGLQTSHSPVYYEANKTLHSSINSAPVTDHINSSHSFHHQTLILYLCFIADIHSFYSFYHQFFILIPYFTVNFLLYNPLHKKLSYSFEDLLHHILII